MSFQESNVRFRAILSRMETIKSQAGGDLYGSIERAILRFSGGDQHERDYWKKLKARFNLSKVYYPGCGPFDDIPKAAFKTDQIVYSDIDELALIERRRLNRNPGERLVVSDFGRSAFADNRFDLIFLQDIHTTPHALQEGLRVLQPGGLVLYSTDGCKSDHDKFISLEDLAGYSQLTELNLPFSNKYYTAFQKTE